MRQFPVDLQGQRQYIRAGGCGDMYPQRFRDFAADHLTKAATTDMQLCTSLAFLFMRWQVAELAAAQEIVHKIGA